MDMLKKLMTEVNEEDFLIRVRPFANDDGAWSGEVDISIMAMPDNPLDDDDYYKVMHFAKMNPFSNLKRVFTAGSCSAAH